jgi:xanthine dehydrogenase accessory factor
MLAGVQHTNRERRKTVSTVAAQVSVWEQRGDRIALALVVGADRSAPRLLGTKMAINDRGQVFGGGSRGCVEGAVVEIAQRVIRGSGPQLTAVGISDDESWGVGVPCGGQIDVWVERYSTSRFLQIERAGGRAVEVTVLEGADVGHKLLVEADGTPSGTLGSAARDTKALEAASQLLWGECSVRRGTLFYDVAAPPPRLIVVGAIDIAVALCKLAHARGWRTYVVDPRSRFAARSRFPDAAGVFATWPAEAFAILGEKIDAATSIVVLSHDAKIDDAALTVALRSAARFVGAIGSRTATAARRPRLLAAGLGEHELDRLSALGGLDLGAQSNDETALSVLAEVVAARHDGSDGRLADATGPIHAVVM